MRMPLSAAPAMLKLSAAEPRHQGQVSPGNFGAQSGTQRSVRCWGNTRLMLPLSALTIYS